MVDTLKNKTNAVTQMKKVSQMVDDPEWIKTNDKRLDLEEKISQEQWKTDTAQKTVEDLTPKRGGIAAKMLQEEQQLYKVEKSWGGLESGSFPKIFRIE
jgi:predicted  nucleic acid-binding Zn-ribbon protein